MKMGKSSGLSLVELVIVFAVIAVVAAIAVPGYQAFSAQRRLNGAARMVMSDLMAARMKAVTLNQKVKIFFGNSSYRICNDADGNGTVEENEGENLSRDIHPQYHDVSLSRSADPIFHPRGTAMLGGTVTLNNSQGFKYAIVALTGRVRISDAP